MKKTTESIKTPELKAINIKMPIAEWKKLDEYAKIKRRGKSELVREFIRSLNVSE